MKEGYIGRKSIAGLILTAAFALPVLSFLCASAWGDVPSDASLFRYVGWRMATGGAACTDAFENKGPLLFMLNALGYRLSPGGEWGPRLVFLGLWLWTTYAIFLLGRPLGRIVSATAALFFSVTALGMTGADMLLDNVEIVGLSCALAGLLAGNGRSFRRAFAAGVFAGGAFLSKPNLAGFSAGLLALWAYDAASDGRWRRFAGRTASAAAGAILVLLAATVASGTHAYDVWDGMLFYNLLEYQRYRTDVSWFEWWWRFFMSVPVNRLDGRQLMIFLSLFVPAAFGACSMWRRNLRPLCVTLVAWLAVETAMSLCAKGFYPHYFLPAVGALSIPAVAGCLDGQMNRRLRVAMVCLLLAVGCFEGRLCFMGVRVAKDVGSRTTAICRKVRDNVGNGRRVAVFGGQVLAETLVRCRLVSPQRYFVLPFHYPYAAPERRREMEREVLSALTDPGVDWLITEDSAAMMARYFADPEIGRQLERWHLAGHAGELHLYKRQGGKVE